MNARALALALALLALLALPAPGAAAGRAAGSNTLANPPAVELAAAPRAVNAALGSHIVVAWNDLGMHCMNLSHANLSVLPPYNTLLAQVILRGDSSNPPRVVTAGLNLEYSIPGNTYSVGKTDFWTYDQAIFGVDLPPNVGLAGKGLTGTLDPATGHFIALGIPVTPFPDAQPTVEDPYQQALVIAKTGGGVELARSAPVIPVSVEMHCVSSGCHASEIAILNGHEAVPGFDPNDRPVFCAGCHADPALGTPGIAEARYFSQRMHDNHIFLDEARTGTDVCYACHPGPNARCLRGTMSQHWGLVCQDCHGMMRDVATSIELGRTPWLEEPSCRNCHTERFGEPVGQLFRNSVGHGGVYCAACHGSPHAEYPSREARDNANMIALQGTDGVLRDCVVCHGTNIAGPGPHGAIVTSVVEEEIVGDSPGLLVYPNPTRGACTVVRAGVGAASGSAAASATVIVYDAEGRVVRMLRPEAVAREEMRARWDGRDASGAEASAGIYFVRWRSGGTSVGEKLIVLR